MVIAALLIALLTGGADSASADRLYAEAELAYHQGDQARARSLAARIVVKDTKNAGYFSLLGDILARDGDLTGAGEAFRKSLALRPNPDVETLRKLGTVSVWTRQFESAREAFSNAIAVAPDDEGAHQDLRELQFQRSLHLFTSMGSAEIDYATSVYDAEASAGWLDWLDFDAEYSMTDRVFYRRSTISGDAYIFPGSSVMFRIGLRDKQYAYPVALNPHPDLSSHMRSGHLQLEASYAYGAGNSASVEIEYFRSEFYWNSALHANNLKLTLSWQTWILRPVYAKVFAAYLHDPDPASFLQDPVSGMISGFGYEALGLLGGGAGYDDGRLSVETKVVPDRDLDHSLAWSLFSYARYDFGLLAIRYDFLYDRFVETATRGFSASRVNVVTVSAAPTLWFEINAGMKLLTREVTSAAPFLSIRLKTGI